MENSLILKKETALQKVSANDIFSFYELEPAINKIVAKEKHDFISTFCGGTSYVNLIQQLRDSSKLVVEIPEKFRAAIENGYVGLGNSQQVAGNYTPNIIQDGKIVGQVTLKETVDMAKVSDGVANLAVMTMLQNAMGKLEAIDEKVTSIIRNQKNDWIGEAIGAFISFAELYPTFRSREELIQQANLSYSHINMAMAKMFAHMNDLRNELDQSPRTIWQTLKTIMKYPRNIPEEMESKYMELMGDIQVYNRLLMLKEYLLYIKQGSIETFTEHNRPYLNFCKERLSGDFKPAMEYLNDRPATEIDLINGQRILIENRMNSIQDQTLKFEVTKEELLSVNN